VKTVQTRGEEFAGVPRYGNKRDPVLFSVGNGLKRKPYGRESSRKERRSEGGMEKEQKKAEEEEG